MNYGLIIGVIVGLFLICLVLWLFLGGGNDDDFSGGITLGYYNLLDIINSG